MNYIFDNNRPIYIQLVEKLRLQIVSGELSLGERIMSVRELALIEKVNPNTIQKALVELESEGLVSTDSTNGRYVTKDKVLIKKIKKELAINKVNNYLNDMQNIGIDLEESIEYLKEIGRK